MAHQHNIGYTVPCY